MEGNEIENLPGTLVVKEAPNSPRTENVRMWVVGGCIAGDVKEVKLKLAELELELELGSVTNADTGLLY
jgi:hypothetical protein